MTWARQLCVVALGAAAVSAPEPAHASCSVLDNRPCLPSVCSVLDRQPCIPEIPYPFSQDLRYTIQARPADTPPGPPAERANTLQEMFKAIAACFTPPPEVHRRPGMEITIRMSLTRDGAILGEPRFTFVTRDVPQEVRTAYQQAMAEMVSRCTPVKLTPQMGNAIAGRPFSMRFIDDRGQKRTERRHD